MHTNVLIAYGTKYGATAEIAQEIGKTLQQAGAQVTVMPADQVMDLMPYEAVIVGSAVYEGHWRKEAALFLESNRDTLAHKLVWLFSSGPLGKGDPVTLLHGWQFPQNLQAVADDIHPRGIAVFHGKIDPDKMHLGDKLIARAMRAAQEDFRDWAAIRDWANRIAEQLVWIAKPLAGLQDTSH